MPSRNTVPLLSPKFALALQFANEIHAKQARKPKPGTADDPGAPYISHLLGVCALVLEYRGTETQAIAALLHDAAEDCGGRPMLEAVRALFGDPVAEIVEACTDSFAESPDQKDQWLPRKRAYLALLAREPAAAKLVSCADKLHNISNTLRDIDAEGEGAWIARMERTKNGSARKQCCYYGGCLSALSTDWAHPMLDELARQVERLRSRVGRPDWSSLDAVNGG